jgi:hypothetical protein
VLDEFRSSIGEVDLFEVTSIRIGETLYECLDPV